MTINEAKKIIKEQGIKLRIEDAMFGDGSVSLASEYLFDSKREAEDYIKALKVLVNEINKTK